MAEEIKETIETKPVEQNYIEQIQKLKENTVTKEEYDKVVADNAKLVEALTNGKVIEGEKEKKPTRTKEELRKILFDEDSAPNNLDYCKAAIELRDLILAEKGPDPFLPWGKNISPTAEDVECANRVADAMKQCIEYADGDSELFTNELMRITNDAAPMAGKVKRR